MDRQCHESCLYMVFMWVENTSQFNKDFKEKYNEDSDKGYFLVVDCLYPEKLHDLHSDLPWKLKTLRNLQPIFTI